MKRLLLFSGTTLLTCMALLAGAVAWLTLTSSGMRWSLGQLSAALDRQLTFVGAEGTLAGPLHFSRVDYLHDDTHISATDVRLQWRPTALLGRRLAIETFTVGALKVTLPATQKTVPNKGDVGSTLPDIRLPLKLSLENMTVNHIDIRHQQQQFSARRLYLSATTPGQRIRIKQCQLDSDSVVINLSGTVQMRPNLPHKLVIDWRYQATGATRIGGHGKLVGDLSHTRLSQQITEPVPLQVHADLLDLAGIPKGDVRLSRDKQRLHVQLQAQATNGSPALAFDWHNLAWPVSGMPQISSDSGSGWLRGSPENFQLGLAGDWHDRQTDAMVYATGHGNSTGVQIEPLRIESAAGNISAKASVNWSPNLSWQADVTVAGLNPGHWLPDWPGTINATLSAQGKRLDGRDSAQLSIGKLRGSIRDYPVTAAGQLQLRNDNIFVRALKLSSAGSHIDINGHVNDTLALDWRLDSTNLAELLPNAAGRLHVDGRLSGRRDAPRIEAQLEGRQVDIAGVHMDNVVGDVDLTPQHPWQTLGTITIANLHWHEHQLQHLTLDTNRQGLSLTASGTPGDINLLIEGSATASGWRGQISRADIHSQTLSDWRLDSAATLRIDNLSTMTLAPLCWRGRQDGRLCLSATRHQDDWQASLDGSGIPLALFDSYLPEDIHLQGRGELSASLQKTAATTSGQARVGLAAGRLSFPIYTGEQSDWNFHSGRAVINLDEQGLTAQTQITVNDSDHVNARVVLPHFHLARIDPEQQNIEGHARLTMTELNLLDLLVPDSHISAGSINGELTLAGTLAEPRFDGHVSLENGAVAIPRLGLMLKPVSIQGQTDVVNQLRFSADADSGDGHLHISGHTDLARQQGWPTSLHVNGEAFEISHIPEARVLVSPDLDLSLDRHKVKLSGSIQIPYARLQQKNTVSTAQVSDDAVIVNAERPPEPRWQLSANVRVKLGDQVRYSGFGFQGRMIGALDVKTEPGQLTTATGELAVAEGYYLAYRQRLDIERGRLIYTGGPLSNPGLDLRAVRHINDVTAGLKVHGSLTHPRLELFSEPAMEQNNILAYLLLGHPLASSTGEEGALLANAALALGNGGGRQLAQSIERLFNLDEMRIESNVAGDQYSVVIGKHLSPRLYVSYGVGQVDVLNTFNIRYQISDKWQLTAENGEHEGADLLYTIER